jgi:predicted DNA-binding protein (MmcQ/YjbR family)
MTTVIGNLNENEINDYLLQTAIRNAWNISMHKETIEDKAMTLWRIKVGEEDKNFLVIHKGVDPLRIDLRCKRELSKMLQEKFESVMPSRVMSPKDWVEIICSGQIAKEELLDLIRAGIEIVLSEE